jgi:hypothetical protein
MDVHQGWKIGDASEWANGKGRHKHDIEWANFDFTFGSSLQVSLQMQMR